MKKVIPITSIFLFFCLSLFAQLEGKYTISYNGLGYKSYTFLKDNKFEYQSFLCTHGEQAKGTYKINNEKITFHYERDSIAKSIIEIDSFSSHDSIRNINLEIYDKDNGEPLIGVSVTSEDLSWGSITDFDGKLELITESTRVINKLLISYTFYDITSIPIQTNYNYNIKIYLFPTFFKHPEVDSESFDFKRKNNKIFLKSYYKNSEFEKLTYQPNSN
jgi:hypothetical protein